jgi:hypothetical protein
MAVDMAGYVWFLAPDASPPAETSSDSGTVIGWVDPATSAVRVDPLDLSAAGLDSAQLRDRTMTLAVTPEAAWIGIAATSIDGTDPGTVGGLSSRSTIVRVAIDRSSR